MKIIIDLQGCQTENRFKASGKRIHALTSAFLREAASQDVWLALNSAFHESATELRNEFSDFISKDRILLYDVASPVAQTNPAHAARAAACELAKEHFFGLQNADVIWNGNMFEGWADDAITSIGQIPSQALHASTLHDLAHLSRQDIYFKDGRYRAWYYRKLNYLKQSNLLFTFSDSVRTEAISSLSFPENRIVTIGAGVANIFSHRLSEGLARKVLADKFGLIQDFIFYNGGFGERNNLNLLLLAYLRLPPSVRQHYALVLGGIITSEQRQQLLDAAGPELQANEIIFTGYLTEENLANCYRACAAFVYPSSYEGFATPVLEAMACGAPVLAADTSSIPEIIADRAALFSPHDAGQLSALLGRVLSDRQFSNALSESGIRKASGFSWERSASLALAALEQQREMQIVGTTARVVQGRPKLAYVSPLPPARSGISDYSAQLLPSLSAYYDIELVVDQLAITDSYLRASFPLRSLEWFEHHGDKFDRVLYHVGNSPFHAHMLGLIGRFPGTVVLHDTYLDGLVGWISETLGEPAAYLKALYDSHGYEALIAEKIKGRDYARQHYPLSFPIFKDSLGVLLHSQYALDLARRYYGEAIADKVAVIPFPKPVPSINRQAARAALGIGEGEFVVCSFGLLNPHKLNHRLLDAWQESSLAGRSDCRLIFVGQNHGGEYGRQLIEKIKSLPSDKQIKITGFCDSQTYAAYLQAADVGVQFRAHSRGETSAAVFDCLAYGLPLVVNSHGTMAELPANVVVKLPDAFSDEALVDVLEELYSNAGLRQGLAAAGRELVLAKHQPAEVAASYANEIERFTATNVLAKEQTFYGLFGRALGGKGLTKADIEAIASVLAHARPPIGQQQILVDVSAIALNDLKTGIQRVVRNVLRQWGESEIDGYRVEPIRYVDGQYVYARSYTLGMLGMDQGLLVDEPVMVQRGDIVLALDWAAETVTSCEAQFHIWRERGAEVYFIVYDLLPLLQPAYFPPRSDRLFKRWLIAAARAGTGLICISRAVADELVSWLDGAPIERQAPLRIGYFHLGADAQPELGHMVGRDVPQFERIHPGWPTVLMVGTVEPRKGHREAMAAFEQLWSRGAQINLIVIGRRGWMVDDLVADLQRLQSSGRPLVWLEGADDITLQAAYRTSDILLAASEGEGFGLPLIEAAQHQLDVLARDLPVFREVGEDCIRYFENRPGGLARALQEWLDDPQLGGHKGIEDLRWLSWKQSAKWLLDMLLDEQHFGWMKSWQGGQTFGHDFAEELKINLVDGQPEVTMSGWAVAEDWGRWSDAMRARLSIAYNADSLRGGDLGLHIDAGAFLTEDHPSQHFMLSVNGVELFRWEWNLEQVPEPVQVSIPESCLRSRRTLELVIDCPDRKSPSSLGISSDTRNLGIAVRSVRLSYGSDRN